VCERRKREKRREGGGEGREKDRENLVKISQENERLLFKKRTPRTITMQA
jgi:hypothetical protein